MDITKDKILEDIHEAMGMVEDLGASEELTNLSIKLGEIAEQAEYHVDAIKEFIPICG
jgi:hypothetical protein